MRFLPLLPVLFLTACEGETDAGTMEPDPAGDAQERESRVLALSGEVAAGELAYADNCEACHAADGSGGYGPDIIGASLASTVGALIVAPTNMPDFAGLEDQTMADIAAYCETL